MMTFNWTLYCFSIVAENLAVVSMWGGDWYDFYIVEKDDQTASLQEPNPTCIRDSLTHFLL